MTIKSDPLEVLLRVNKESGSHVDEELIKECYQIQKEQQYNKDRDSIKKIEALIETSILQSNGDVLI